MRVAPTPKRTSIPDKMLFMRGGTPHSNIELAQSEIFHAKSDFPCCGGILCTPVPYMIYCEIRFFGGASKPVFRGNWVSKVCY
jgi:hypothetical protein